MVATDHSPDWSTHARDALLRAETYPYARGVASFCLRHGTATPLIAEECAGRVPVLAFGSNASAAQLRRKFPHAACLPVTAAVLFDHAVVYAAHIAGYGAVPATLAPAAGASAKVAITWLDQAQLALMDASEARGVRYDAVQLAAPLRDQVFGWRETVHTYVSRHGCWWRHGAPVALAAVAMHGVPFARATTDAVLRDLHATAGGTSDYSGFVLRLAHDAAFRDTLRAALPRHQPYVVRAGWAVARAGA